MTATPLEEFVRDYVETIGGVWDEIEPQVYDLLVPSNEPLNKLDIDKQTVLRIAFDPEAIPEHPGSQLAGFGTPLIDGMLADAVRRGRYARFYVLGLNLAPHDLAGRVRRSLSLGRNSEFRLERVRALHFPQALFWFQGVFVSDQKEQEILSVAIDLHFGRQVRHLEKLLEQSRLADRPAMFLPEARRLSASAAYPIARAEVLRSLAAMAHGRDRELRERLERQAARMTRYYADLRKELDEQEGRGKDSDEAKARRAGRREAVEREERLRIAELRQKNSLRVQLRLLNLVLIHQPKLLIDGILADERRSTSVELVWDPLTETLEAVPCPLCRRPTFALGLPRQGGFACSNCSEKTSKK